MYVITDFRGAQWTHTYGYMYERQVKSTYFVHENKLDPKSRLVEVQGLSGTLRHINDIRV